MEYIYSYEPPGNWLRRRHFCHTVSYNHSKLIVRSSSSNHPGRAFTYPPSSCDASYLCLVWTADLHAAVSESYFLNWLHSNFLNNPGPGLFGMSLCCQFGEYFFDTSVCESTLHILVIVPLALGFGPWTLDLGPGQIHTNVGTVVVLAVVTIVFLAVDWQRQRRRLW